MEAAKRAVHRAGSPANPAISGRPRRQQRPCSRRRNARRVSLKTGRKSLQSEMPPEGHRVPETALSLSASSGSQRSRLASRPYRSSPTAGYGSQDRTLVQKLLAWAARDHGECYLQDLGRRPHLVLGLFRLRDYDQPTAFAACALTTGQQPHPSTRPRSAH